MGATNQGLFNNYATLVIQGSFDLSAAAAVLTLTYPGGQTATCRGDNLSCAKGGTGSYTVTLKGTGATKFVEVLYSNANLQATTLATALTARVAAVAQPGGSSGDDITITVITAQTTGAAADTTAAVTVCFEVALRVARMTSSL